MTTPCGRFCKKIDGKLCDQCIDAEVSRVLAEKDAALAQTPEARLNRLHRHVTEMYDLLDRCDELFRLGVPVSNQSTLAADIKQCLATLDGAR